MPSYANNSQHSTDIDNETKYDINEYDSIVNVSRAVSDSSDSNIGISVPTRVQCIVKADGTIISPSSEAWQIKNNSTASVAISSVSSSNLLNGSTITATSQPTSLYDNMTGIEGSYVIDISNAGSKIEAIGAKEDNPLQIAPQQSLGFDWNVDVNDESIHDMTSNMITVTVLSFHFKSLEKEAFAVYSTDDNSLDFYKRLNVPKAGDIFNGKIVSDVYTGFENRVFTVKNALGGYTYDENATVDSPWFAHCLDVTNVEVIDNDIKPSELKYWFQNFQNCTTFKLNKLDTSKVSNMLNTFDLCYRATTFEVNEWDVRNVNTLSQTWLACQSLKSLDLSKWNTANLQSLGSTWNGCSSLSELKVGYNWDVSKVTTIGCMFDATKFEKVDLSSWNFSSDSINLYAAFINMSELRELDISSIDNSNAEHLGYQATTIFQWSYRLQKVTVSDRWSWQQSWVHLLVPDSQHITGADGKWYSMTTGIGYATDDMPSNVADTYVASKELLPMKSFAVYSDTDNSLNLYRRRLSDVPSVGNEYNSRTVTSIYFGFETSNLSYNDSEYEYGIFHDVGDRVTSISVVDEGIKPQSMRGWFSNFSQLISVNGFTKIDMAECVDTRYCFYQDAKLHTVDLSNWNCPVLTTCGGMFERCWGLESINLDNWSAPNLTHIWYFVYGAQLQEIDLSTCKINGITHMRAMLSSNTRLTKVTWMDGFSFKNVTNADLLFEHCLSLELDCSSYDFSVDCSHNGFNLGSKNVTLPSVWKDA